MRSLSQSYGTSRSALTTSPRSCGMTGIQGPARGPDDELIAQAKTIVEDAGHYADGENLYVSAAERADGEPVTDDDANATAVPKPNAPGLPEPAGHLGTQPQRS